MNNNYERRSEVEESTKTRVIGKIRYNHDQSAILGRGSDGTVVYRGQFDGRPVAVKRVLADQVDLVEWELEVNLLRLSDGHRNVIRYYDRAADHDFYYLALELCHANLHDFVHDKTLRSQYPDLNPTSILRQLIKGIVYLHSLNIVHRDIKPRNILLADSNHRPLKSIVKISDFGLGKLLRTDQTSISGKSGVRGTYGWMAAECLQHSERRVPRSADIFSLGCVFYFVLNDGSHPFGDEHKRQSNICDDKYDLQPTHALSQLSPIAIELIDLMLQHEASQRPSAYAVENNIFFWTKKEQLEFIKIASDRLESERKEIKKKKKISDLLDRLEEKGVVFNGEWDQIIGDKFLKELTHRTPDYSSVFDLLRVVRNMYSHYFETSIDFRASLKPYPDGLVKYITTRFPMLLLHTYRTMHMCAGEPDFGDFYRSYQTALPTVNRTSLATAVTAITTAAAVVASENTTPLVGVAVSQANIAWPSTTAAKYSVPNATGSIIGDISGGTQIAHSSGATNSGGQATDGGISIGHHSSSNNTVEKKTVQHGKYLSEQIRQEFYQ